MENGKIINLKRMNCKINYFYLLCILTFCMIQFTKQNDDVETIPKKGYEIRFVYCYDTTVYMIRFLKFDDVKLLNDVSNLRSTKREYYNGELNFLYLPKRQIVLDSSFTIYNRFLQISAPKCIVIRFFHFAGFDVDLFELSFFYNQTRFDVMFQITSLSLYKKGQKLNVAECEARHFTRKLYFNGLNTLIFQYGNRYDQQTCSLLFKNAKIYQLYVDYLSDCFIKRNLLGFISPPNETGENGLESEIKKAWIFVYKVKLDNRLLNEQVFEQTIKLFIKGEIGRIESSLFRRLNRLSYVYIRISNTRAMFSQGIDWIKSINGFLNVNMSNKSSVIKNLNNVAVIQTYKKVSLLEGEKNMKLLEKPYMFLDEDFCLFVEYPFQQLVFMNPHTVCVNNNCSCTLLWLLKYVYRLRESKHVIEYLTQQLSEEYPFYFDKYDKQLAKCDFEQRINKTCLNKTVKTINEVRLTFYSALVISQYVEFVVVILLPIVGIAGIVTNIVNIQAIARVDLTKTPEDRQQKTLMRFMLAYSIVNLIYCLIHTLSLLSICIDQDSVFCSDLYYTQFAQYYKIIFVEFMGANFKSLSNLIYFAISVNRYILLEKDGKLASFTSRIVLIIHKKVKIAVILIIVTVSFGFNTHKLIIYQVLDTGVVNLFYDKYPILFFSLPFFVENSHFYDENQNYGKDAYVNLKSSIYEVFTFVNFALNDVVIFFTFTVVDILLLIAFKKSTEKKMSFIKLNMDEKRMKKKLTELEQAVKNVFKVILVNIFLLLTVKSYDFFISLSKFNIWKQGLLDTDSNRKLNGFCHLVKICSSYEDLTKVAYMIYYCFSTVMFYYLNRNFRSNLGCCKKNTKTINSLIVATYNIPIQK